VTSGQKSTMAELPNADCRLFEEYYTRLKKYRELNIENPDAFQRKVAEIEDDKKFWWAIQKACNSFDRFHDSEEYVPWKVQEIYGKLVVEKSLLDEASKAPLTDMLSNR
jgi:hypothetical protein